MTVFDISTVDAKLQDNQAGREEALQYCDVRKLPVDFYGLYAPRGEGPFCRMPLDVAESVSRSVFNLSKQTAGGRIRFRTDSRRLAFHVVQREKVRYFAHMTFLGTSGFDLYQVDRGQYTFVKSFRPPIDRDKEFDVSVELPDASMREFVLNFPLYDWVSELYMGVEPGATVCAGTGYTAAEKPVVFYGSSVTQGGCASRPGTFHCALLSRWLDMDYICLGFSGSAKGEPEMADYLAQLDPAAYVIEYDYNAPDAEHLRRTHEPLFQKLRGAHPDVPILLVSCVTLPTVEEGKELPERRAVIRRTYENARAAGDSKVWFLDGGTVLAPFGGNECTVDGAHPTDLGFWLMARAWKPYLEEMLHLNQKR